MNKKEFITYKKYGDLIISLCDRIKHMNYKFDAIIAPPRGALPIAVHFSHHLNISNILITNSQIMDFISKDISLLIVDDIVDTGKTLSILTKRILEVSNINIITASLYYKTRSIFKPNFYCYETTNWIVFPYENVDEIPNREGYDEI